MLNSSAICSFSVADDLDNSDGLLTDKPTPCNASESHDSDLSDTEIDREILKLKPENTNSATNWSVSKFNQWQSRRTMVNIDFKTSKEEDIAAALKKFYMEVR